MFQYVCYLCTPLSTLARKFKKDFLTQTSRERDREGGEITHCNTHNTHTHTHTHTITRDSKACAHVGLLGADAWHQSNQSSTLARVLIFSRHVRYLFICAKINMIIFVFHPRGQTETKLRVEAPIRETGSSP